MAVLWRLGVDVVEGMVRDHVARTGEEFDVVYEEVIDQLDPKDFLDDVISTMDYLLDPDIETVFEDGGVPTYMTPDETDVLELTTEEIDDILGKWGVEHTEEQRLGFYALLQDEDVLVDRWSNRVENYLESK